jgi:hypothetical protein
VIRVSPTARAPKISARCETDLSPGTCAMPERPPDDRGARRAAMGVGS